MNGYFYPELNLIYGRNGVRNARLVARPGIISPGYRDAPKTELLQKRLLTDEDKRAARALKPGIARGKHSESERGAGDI